MTNMDEFACGSSGETSAYGACQNPSAIGRIPGGSSSGSAASVAAGFCDMTLGSDTGGSIRNPASHCGVVGVKPTYGSVSRYGLIDLSMSLDQIGPLASNVKDAKLLLDTIKGRDENDSISRDFNSRDFVSPTTFPHPPTQKSELNKRNRSSKNDTKNLTIGVLDLSDLKLDERIQDLINKKTEEVAKKNNWKIKKVKIPHLELAISTYYPLVYVEFFSATRRMDGRRYGLKIEDSCGREVLRRLFGGSEISKAEYKGRYYYLALKAKRFFEKSFEDVFVKQNVDCVICPTVPRLPHKIGEKISVEDMYGYDALTIPSNLAGNCAISIPCGKISESDFEKSSSVPHPPTQTGSELNNRNRSRGEDGIPVGMQIVCDKWQDDKMLEIASSFEV